MRFPSLLQINTRFWLQKYSQILGRPATLDDIPDVELRSMADLGLNWIYLLGIWQTGQFEAEIARQQPFLQKIAQTLLDETDENALCSSFFAISGYQVNLNWGGEQALRRLRDRMKKHGLKLMLDFIPNHTGISHPWAFNHPEYYIQAASYELDRGQQAYKKVTTKQGERFLAHGRDPFFPPWTDTFQLNYANAELQAAMISELLKVSRECDGVRCDMAMLILPDVFQQTWGIEIEPFWSKAIEQVKSSNPNFLFVAEVYWDRNRDLLEQGFDYTYDKNLLEALIKRDPHLIFHHLFSIRDIHERQVHFLENHDETRAAKLFPNDIHRLAAAAAYLLPGMRFFFDGQFLGHRVQAPIQLCRPPRQEPDAEVNQIYESLLATLKQFDYFPGSWELLAPIPAWETNNAWQNFLAFTWLDSNHTRWLWTANFSQQQSQCYLRFPLDGLREREFLLKDHFSVEVYLRHGNELFTSGLYLDLAAWEMNLFEFIPQP